MGYSSFNEEDIEHSCKSFYNLFNVFKNFHYIDILTFIIYYFRKVQFIFSIIFTVYIDPFNYSNSEIKTNKNKFFIKSPYVKTLRIVSMFYRFHDIPDFNDWINFIKIFGLIHVPNHSFAFDNNYIIVNIINDSLINLTYYKNGELITSKRFKYSKIDGLLPDKIIKQSII